MNRRAFLLLVCLLAGCSTSHEVSLEVRLEFPPPIGDYLPQLVIALEVGQLWENMEIEPGVVEIHD